MVNVQDDVEMFDVNDLGGEEVFVAEQEVVKDIIENVVEKVVNAAQDSTARTTITTKEITFAQALEALKTSKPNRNNDRRLVKPKKKDQIRLGEERAEKEQEANISLIETWDDIQSKSDADHQLVERLQAQEQEELLVKPKKKDQIRLGEERAKKEQEANISLIETWDDIQSKSDADHQLVERLQTQEQEELVNTFEDFRTELVEGKENRVGEELIQESTKKQKVEDDKEIAELKQLMEIILDKEEVAIDVIHLDVKSPRIVD
nr:hypothetical protein [Tanacetum cinerariifolium]